MAHTGRDDCRRYPDDLHFGDVEARIKFRPFLQFLKGFVAPSQIDGSLSAGARNHGYHHDDGAVEAKATRAVMMKRRVLDGGGGGGRGFGRRAVGNGGGKGAM